MFMHLIINWRIDQRKKSFKIQVKQKIIFKGVAVTLTTDFWRGKKKKRNEKTNNIWFLCWKNMNVKQEFYVPQNIFQEWNWLAFKILHPFFFFRRIMLLVMVKPFLLHQFSHKQMKNTQNSQCGQQYVSDDKWSNHWTGRYINKN